MTVLSSLLHWTEISLEGPHPPKDRRGRTLHTVHERQTVHAVLAGTVSGLFGFRRDGPRVKRGGVEREETRWDRLGRREERHGGAKRDRNDRRCLPGARPVPSGRGYTAGNGDGIA
eukprot:scaffold622_cov335-Pavlova_lutheri.AAC.8